MSSTIQITEVCKPGQVWAARIHAAGCRDIDVDRTRGYTDTYDMDTDGQGWLEANFGDIASDNEEPGTPAFDEAIRSEAAEVTICACARSLGFTF